jgi:hypothetical protein
LISEIAPFPPAVCQSVGARQAGYSPGVSQISSIQKYFHPI